MTPEEMEKRNSLMTIYGTGYNLTTSPKEYTKPDNFIHILD